MHTRRPVTSFGLWGKNGTIRNDGYKSEDRQAHGGSTELIYYAQSNIYRDQQNLDKRYAHGPINSHGGVDIQIHVPFLTL